MSSVRDQIKYPHYSLGQVSGFIGQNLQFYQLSYEQFVAGELATITACSDQAEIEVRTELLHRISLWQLRANVKWTQVRNTYDHILRKIENYEMNWYTDWDRFERHIYDTKKQTKSKPVQFPNQSGIVNHSKNWKGVVKIHLTP